MMLLEGLKLHDEAYDFKLAHLARIIHESSSQRRPQSGRLIVAQHFRLCVRTESGSDRIIELG